MRLKNIMIVTLVVLLAVVSAGYKKVYAEPGHGKEGKAEKVQIESEEGHRHPENWLFRLPHGNIPEGRKTFIKFECFSCHEVKGENFPKPEGEAVGPELSQMGPMHPLEYFAESTINPSAEISGKRYMARDGSSKMPSFNEYMTVEELNNLSVYLSSLRLPGMLKFVKGEGIVIVVLPNKEQIVIMHGRIKGFMDSMTMGYKVQSPSLFNGLNPGDKIHFNIDTEKNVIVKIVKLEN